MPVVQIGKPDLAGYLNFIDRAIANLQGKASESQIRAIIDQAAADNYRAAGGRLTREQARARVEGDIRDIAAKNNADADSHMLLIAGVVGLGLLAWLLKGKQ